MHYLGIDVSKATLDVSDAPGDSRLSSVANSRVGIRKVIRWATRGNHTNNDELQFVIEPTSTYHHVLLDELSNSNIAFTVINPARTKAYSNSLGKRAKTDRVDAQLLASLGETQQIARSHQPKKFQEQIKSLRRHRELVEQQIRSLRNQIGSVTCSPWTDPEVRRSLRSTVRHLQSQVKAADQRPEQLISEDETYSTVSDLLQTIPGVGPKTAQLLLSEMPPGLAVLLFKGLGRLRRGLSAAVPRVLQATPRLSRMGGRRVRTGMYMAGVASMKSNPAIAYLVERLKERGKRGKLIVMAALNKLIQICYGVIKSRKAFDRTLNIAPQNT